MSKIEEYLSKKEVYRQARDALLAYTNRSWAYKIETNIKDNSVELIFKGFGEIAKKFFIERLIKELDNIAMKAREDIYEDLNKTKEEAKAEMKDILS